MTGYKKYPHVPCRSIHLRMDRMLEVLECHRRTLEGWPCTCMDESESAADIERVRKECEVDIEELRKVIAYRGNVLSIQKRRGRFSGEYLTVTRERGD